MQKWGLALCTLYLVFGFWFLVFGFWLDVKFALFRQQEKRLMSRSSQHKVQSTKLEVQKPKA